MRSLDFNEEDDDADDDDDHHPDLKNHHGKYGSPPWTPLLGV